MRNFPEELNAPVEEYTTPNPLTAPETATVDELTQILKDNGVRHLPITNAKGDKIVGVVSDRDLRVVAGLDFTERNMVRAMDIMAPNPVTVSSDSPLDEVALQMSEKKIGSVIVNEGDQLLGIFTVTDALNALIEITRAARG